METNEELKIILQDLKSICERIESLQVADSDKYCRWKLGPRYRNWRDEYFITSCGDKIPATVFYTERIGACSRCGRKIEYMTVTSGAVQQIDYENMNAGKSPESREE